MWYTVDMGGRKPLAMNRGVTLIEILLVIAVLAILFVIVLVSIRGLSKRSQDVKIRNDVRQLRLLAEQVYDEEGANYANWSTHRDVVEEVELLRDNIDEVHSNPPGTPWESVIIDSREDEYCISAPLRAGEAGHLCVDASGEFLETDTPCSLPGVSSIPLVCQP